MFFKKITVACAAASLMMIPTAKVQANDLGAFAAGAIIGGVVGHSIGKNHTKKKRVVRRTYSAPKQKRKVYVDPAVKSERREIQTALNYFGFPAGSADGVLGRKSKAAISNYQAHLNYPATGQLTQYEKEFLLTSYRRALAGGALTTQQIAANPYGPKGLLNQYRNEAAGVVTTANPYQQQQLAPATTTVVAIAPQAVQPQVLQVQPQVQQVQPQVLGVQAPAASAIPQIQPVPVVAPAPAAPAIQTAPAIQAAAPAVPSFMATPSAEPTQASLASHCNQIGLMTNSNGGFTTTETLQDASFAMNEQFCLARTYAISLGEKAAAQIQGFTQAQIEQQCAAFAPLLKPHVEGLSAKPKDTVLLEVANFATSTGQSPAQLGGTASICLSVGYRTDNMDVATGSALLLAAVGQPAYGELIGHHLAHGFGVVKSVEQSMPWFEMSMEAIEGGAPAVFNPGDPTRTALLRKATANMNGAPAIAEVQPAAAQAPTALPSFTVSE